MFMCMGTVTMFLLPPNSLEIVIIFLCLICFAKGEKNGISPALFRKAISLVFAFIAGSYFTGVSIGNYFGLILRISLATMILSIFRNRMELLKENIYVSLWFLTIYGAINYIAAQLLAPFYHPIQLESGYYTHTCGYIFFSQEEPSLGSLYRNPGLFWEPGLFQFPINLLIYYILVVYKKPLKDCLIPILVLASTISGTGVLIMSIIICYRLFVIDKIKISAQTIISFTIFLIVLLPFVYIILSDKLVGESAGTSGARLYDLIFGLQVVSDNPIFGIGYDVEKYVDMMSDISLGKFYDENYEFGHHQGNTNTIISIFMLLGIPVGCIFLFGLLKQRLFPKMHLFTAIVILSILSEPLTSVTFIWLIVLSSSMSCHRSKQYSLSKNE